MKRKYKLLLLIVFAVAVTVTVALASRPTVSLFDYALTLEENMFACGRGYVWNVIGELEDGHLQVEKIGEAEERKFIKHHEYQDPMRMCAWEMADCFVYTFVRSDGSVWAATDVEDMSDILEIRPFAIPAAEYEDTGKLWLSGFHGSGSGQNGYSLFAGGQLECMKTLENAEVHLAALFKDGWHYICSAESTDPWSNDVLPLKRIDMQGVVPMYNMELYFGRCYFDTAEYNNTFDIKFRIDVLDGESGELIAAKNLAAENRSGHISAHKHYYNYAD